MPTLPKFPVVEMIVRDVVKTLEGVSPAAGWPCAFVVERPRPRLGNQLTDGKAIVFLGDATPAAQGEHPQDVAEWDQEIIVRCHVVEGDGSDVGVESRLIVATATVIAALCETAEVRQRDGWAIDTMPGSVYLLPREYDSNEGTADVTVIVQYRHLWNNPFRSPHRS